MLKISFQSSKKPNEVLEGAESFFVEKGLKTDEKDESSIGFQSNEGYVRLNVTHQSEVTIETVEWENQVKQFAERYK